LKAVARRRVWINVITTLYVVVVKLQELWILGKGGIS
jgi:hypothetical protein